MLVTSVLKISISQSFGRWLISLMNLITYFDHLFLWIFIVSVMKSKSYNDDCKGDSHKQPPIYPKGFSNCCRFEGSSNYISVLGLILDATVGYFLDWIISIPPLDVIFADGKVMSRLGFTREVKN